MRECLPNCGTGGCEVCMPSNLSWPLKYIPKPVFLDDEITPEDERNFYKLL